MFVIKAPLNSYVCDRIGQFLYFYLLVCLSLFRLSLCMGWAGSPVKCIDCMVGVMCGQVCERQLDIKVGLAPLFNFGDEAVSLARSVALLQWRKLLLN